MKNAILFVFLCTSFLLNAALAESITGAVEDKGGILDSSALGDDFTEKMKQLSLSDTDPTINVNSAGITFEFISVDDKGKNELFLAQTWDPLVIDKAREELSKPLIERTLHIHGKIHKAPRCENLEWSWAFDTDRWDLAEISIEVCDARPCYVEEHLDYWLDNNRGDFCPWAARVNRELSDGLPLRNKK